MNFKRNILITGGAGFIGSHLVRLFVNKYPEYRIVNYDVLTYAGNLENLKDIEHKENYVFIKGDICDGSFLNDIFKDYSIDAVIHLAAETHVDRSIDSPLEFVRTNVLGTATLLDVARRHWENSEKGYKDKMFYHISTDEVYGALEMDIPDGKESVKGHKVYGTDFFTENKPYKPRSPYSAAKASSNHFVEAYHSTYGMPTLISSCSNNYGPNQFPEKLIPLVINNIRKREAIPVYGTGENVRDWLFVEDHVKAIDTIFHKAIPGSKYNIGGFNEIKNIDIIKTIIKIVDKMLGYEEGHSEKLITFVTDRKGHDLRYSIDASLLHEELGWQPTNTFDEGIEKTIAWYVNNPQWLESVTSGNYREYYKSMYGERLNIEL